MATVEEAEQALKTARAAEAEAQATLKEARRAERERQRLEQAELDRLAVNEVKDGFDFTAGDTKFWVGVNTGYNGGILLDAHEFTSSVVEVSISKEDAIVFANAILAKAGK